MHLIRPRRHTCPYIAFIESIIASNLFTLILVFELCPLLKILQWLWNLEQQNKLLIEYCIIKFLILFCIFLIKLIFYENWRRQNKKHSIFLKGKWSLPHLILKKQVGSIGVLLELQEFGRQASQRRRYYLHPEKMQLYQKKWGRITDSTRTSTNYCIRYSTLHDIKC
jgi:amino acid transporter